MTISYYRLKPKKRPASKPVPIACPVVVQHPHRYDRKPKDLAIDPEAEQREREFFARMGLKTP